MVHTLKKKLYFVVANYFRFFARIVLERWQPQVIVVTGSNGKTTLLHLIESQLKDQAIYSHKANSAFGVPFHILGIRT
jgi:UDP-N-acetylmuramyl pentapeptide synthase